MGPIRAHISGCLCVCASQDCACTQQTFLQHLVCAENVEVTKTVLAVLKAFSPAENDLSPVMTHSEHRDVGAQGVGGGGAEGAVREGFLEETLALQRGGCTG